MSAAVTEAHTRKLNKFDRCDGCTAEALVQITFPSGLDLLFCGHHYAKNEPALAARGATVTADDRALINTKPSISANAL
jgi:hypothetical protein